MKDIQLFLDTIWEQGEVREIRAFDQSGYTTYGYFDSPAKAASAAAKIASTHEVYITLNPCNPALLARCANRLKSFRKNKDKSTSDHDIANLKYLLIDCDPCRPAKISSSGVELAKAQIISERIIKDLGEPLVYGMSANGYHAIYKHNSTDPENLKAYLELLNKKYGNGSGVDIDLKVFNPSRISKVLGSWGRKGDNITERPWRKSKVISVNPKAAPLEIPKSETPKFTPQTTSTTGFNVREYLNKHSIVIKEEKPWKDATLLLLDSCVFDPSHNGGEAGVLIHPGGKLSYQCFHNSCHGKTWHDLRQAIGDPKKPFEPFVRSTPKEDFTPIEIEPAKLEKPENKRDVPLPLDKVHLIFQEYWKQYDSVTEANKEYVLTALLTAFGSCLGNRIRLKTGFGIVPNLYAILIGNSTFLRKTQSMDIGTMCLKEIAKAQKEEYERDRTDWQDMINFYDGLPKKDRAHQEDPRKNKPKDKSVIYPKECSPEQLLEKMADKSDGIFLYSELGGLLSRLDSGYMAGFKEKLTEFFDGRADRYDRETKSGGLVSIKNAAPSLLSCTTFEWLQDHLGDSDLLSGFLARFVFVAKRTYPKTAVAIQPWFKASPAFMELHQKLMALEIVDLRLSPDAAAYYTKWYEEFRAWSIDQDELVHSFLGRLQNVCHKVAIINHCLDVCVYGAENPGIIEIRAYEQAIPWVDFFAKNILSCYGEITQKTDIKEKKILNIIRKKGKWDGNGTMSISQSKLTKLANMRKKELIEIADTLEMKSLIRIAKRGKYVYWEAMR